MSTSANDAGVRQVARIARVVMYPSRDEQIEIPAGEVKQVAFQAGALLVTQVLADGTQRTWFNVPCLMEHSPPSGLVVPR